MTRRGLAGRLLPLRALVRPLRAEVPNFGGQYWQAQPPGFIERSPAKVLGGEEPPLLSVRFWDDLLLLRVNAPFLISCVRGVDEARLFALRATVSEICCQCVYYLNDANLLRVSHALETLVLILQYVARKQFAVGPARYCLPRHRMPFDARKRGFQVRWMTWRAMCVWP